MNHINVIAYGEPGSFVREVQENPTLALVLKGQVDIAMALLSKCGIPLTDYSDGGDASLVDRVNLLAYRV